MSQKEYLARGRSVTSFLTTIVHGFFPVFIWTEILLMQMLLKFSSNKLNPFVLMPSKYWSVSAAPSLQSTNYIIQCPEEWPWRGMLCHPLKRKIFPLAIFLSKHIYWIKFSIWNVNWYTRLRKSLSEARFLGKGHAIARVTCFFWREVRRFTVAE